MTSAGQFPPARTLQREPATLPEPGAIVGGLTGHALRRLARPGALAAGAISAATLIGANLLFWTLIGAAWELFETTSRGRLSMDSVIQLPFWSLVLLSQTGLILALWPLACLNHRLFFHIREHEDRARATSVSARLRPDS